MIIGLTGPNACGKGEAADYLRKKGFIYYSLSDILREESKRLGIEPVRENLIEIGNRLRREEGSSVLARRTAEKIVLDKDHIIDSIRSPFEIEELKKLSSFILLGIDAPVNLRFTRSLKRNRIGDALTLEDFIKKEEKENKESKENQQLNKCMELVDIKIINDSSIEELYKKIDETIQKIKTSKLG